MSHHDIVIFLCDSLTLPELRKSLLKYPTISIYPTNNEQGSSKQIQNDDTLIYEIDNKYYSATVLFLLLTLPATPSENDEELKTLRGLTSNEETNKVFVWAFSTPPAEKAEGILHRQILPPKPVLDVLVDSQPDRELNYALHLSESVDMEVDSAQVQETFDELGWEYLVQSYGANQKAPSRSGTGQDDEASMEGIFANSAGLDEEDVDEQGIEVILAALQTVMWQGMRRKPKSTFNRAAPLQMESDTPILSGRSSELLGFVSSGESDGAVGDEVLVERRRNVLAEDTDSSKRMEDELEAWLGTEPDATESTAGSSTVKGMLPIEGFDDDFGPFESSNPGVPSKEMHPEASKNPTDELDFDLEVNLESILSQLSQTREDLQNVDDEDERRVRAGREVSRILGMMGMDLGDEAGIDDAGGNDSP